jgi:hypothetical protein
MSNSSYLLVAGCSHTAGVGIDPGQTWASKLAQELDLDLVNLARSGACAKFVSSALIEYLTQTSVAPKLIIAQWPNPYRSMKIVDQKIRFCNTQAMDDEFKQRLKTDPNSFIVEWKNSIIELNTFWAGKIINICLESKQDYTAYSVQDLAYRDIILHLDEKLPGKTWHFDSAARDKIHHSPECHQKWADRILTILENHV